MTMICSAKARPSTQKHRKGIIYTAAKRSGANKRQVGSRKQGRAYGMGKYSVPYFLCAAWFYQYICLFSHTPFIKKMQDRSLPNLLPFFTIRKKQMHHKVRYSNKYFISAYFYGDTSEEERETASEIIYRNSLNTDSKVKDIKFFENAKTLEGVTL